MNIEASKKHLRLMALVDAYFNAKHAWYMADAESTPPAKFYKLRNEAIDLRLRLETEILKLCETEVAHERQ